ncbi:hypothetical protein J2X72_004570 [Phyllobacterium sp. 1468]|nr:hypothetical protein [Phyllobacterium sp. 1468]
MRGDVENGCTLGNARVSATRHLSALDGFEYFPKCFRVATAFFADPTRSAAVRGVVNRRLSGWSRGFERVFGNIIGE